MRSAVLHDTQSTAGQFTAPGRRRWLKGPDNANRLVIDPEGRLIACEGAESNRNGVKIATTPRVTRTEVLEHFHDRVPPGCALDKLIAFSGSVAENHEANRGDMANTNPLRKHRATTH